MMSRKFNHMAAFLVWTTMLHHLLQASFRKMNVAAILVDTFAHFAAADEGKAD
jgi:hypothetical protein